MSEYPIIDEMIAKRYANSTYSSGTMPHTWIELYGGRMIQILPHHPEIKSFRDKYYYNSYENKLFERVAEWSVLGADLECDNAEYVVAPTGRRIPVRISMPDPAYFLDDYYYNLYEQRVYRRILSWRVVNTIAKNDFLRLPGCGEYQYGNELE